MRLEQSGDELHEVRNYLSRHVCGDNRERRQCGRQPHAIFVIDRADTWDHDAITSPSTSACNQ